MKRARMYLNSYFKWRYLCVFNKIQVVKNSFVQSMGGSTKSISFYKKSELVLEIEKIEKTLI